MLCWINVQPHEAADLGNVGDVLKMDPQWWRGRVETLHQGGTCAPAALFDLQHVPRTIEVETEDDCVVKLKPSRAPVTVRERYREPGDGLLHGASRCGFLNGFMALFGRLR